MDEIVKEFLVESYENLDHLDRAMVELERDPRHTASLDSVFRTIHTVKGTCGFIPFPRLEKLAHTGENLLGKIREGVLELNGPRTTALLSMVDAIRFALGTIEHTEQEPPDDYAPIIRQLIELTESDGALPVVEIAPAAAAAPALEIAANSAKPPPAPAPVPATPAQTEVASRASTSGLSESTIRVDVGVLDKLMNLVGELVLARNQILQFSEPKAEKTFVNACQRLNLITTEIQENFMKTRMQPIETVFGKFPRIIRDLSNDLGKRIRLEASGNDTELDRTIIEAIKDPLTHIVRNSVDHGIERPEQRTAAGKSEEGVLSLRAYHAGGQVNIEVADDGAGISADRVRQKAVEKGLITSEHAYRLNEREAFNLIFLPGFSTAEKITNVSGRGVGMDVVKTNIEKIGGSVDVHSEPGRGTTLKIKIPLTLAIIPALIITSHGESFAIPQMSLVELLRLEVNGRGRTVEFIDGAPFFRLRGRLLPLVDLNHVLGLASAESAGSAFAGEAVSVVVVQADGCQFGLVVDDVKDTEEIVVKPLSRQLKNISTFAGATIRGDGRVALILDVMGLAQRAEVLNVAGERLHESAPTFPQAATSPPENLLLFTLGGPRHFALPLSLASRLEEFPYSQIEHTAAGEVAQYRGRILPLIHLADHLLEAGREPRRSDGGTIQVVVYQDGARTFGLVVGSVTDVVEERLSVRRTTTSAGILGSAVIQGRVTDLLDIPAVIRAADPLFSAAPEPAAA